MSLFRDCYCKRDQAKPSKPLKCLQVRPSTPHSVPLLPDLLFFWSLFSQMNLQANLAAKSEVITVAEPSCQVRLTRASQLNRKKEYGLTVKCSEEGGTRNSAPNHSSFCCSSTSYLEVMLSARARWHKRSEHGNPNCSTAWRYFSCPLVWSGILARLPVG